MRCHDTIKQLLKDCAQSLGLRTRLEPALDWRDTATAAAAVEASVGDAIIPDARNAGAGAPNAATVAVGSSTAFPTTTASPPLQQTNTRRQVVTGRLNARNSDDVSRRYRADLSIYLPGGTTYVDVTYYETPACSYRISLSRDVTTLTKRRADEKRQR